MYKLFNNILLPVDLGRHSAAGVKKALQLAARFHCDVHLLHVKRRLFGGKGNERVAHSRMKLHALREQYASLLAKGCVLHLSTREGKLEHAITEYASVHHIDLVLLNGPQIAFNWFRPRLHVNRLAANTGCPVLSLQQPTGLNGMKNIVLPVGNSLPLRKIMLAIYMAKDSNAAIHLISLTGRSDLRNHAYLEKAYQLLRENTSLPIRCKTVEGENIASTTLEYARKVEADLILVNGAESLLSGSLNRMFAKFLFNQSAIPVITVA